MFQTFCFTTRWITRDSPGTPPSCCCCICFVPGANPKKPSAPDMFTESDDMFAADFDVSVISRASELGILHCCHVKLEAAEEFSASGIL